MMGKSARLLSGVVLAAIFGAGLLLGVALRDRSDSENPELVRDETPRDSDTNDQRSRGRSPMYERVGPDERQRVMIDSILAVHRQKMRDLHAEFRANYDPRYRELILQTREAIKEIFTPEQAERYQTLLDEFDQRRSERGSGRNEDGQRGSRPDG